MSKTLTLEYWVDDEWFVGRIKEIPGVFSQGETIDELEDNIKEAYQLIMDTEPILDRANVQRREIEVAV